MSGTDTVFVYTDQLGGTPYLGFAIEAHAALLREGLTGPTGQLVGWINKAVVALQGDTPVGIITYDFVKHSNSFAIYIGYVAPGARRKGIYRKLWINLVSKAQEQKVQSITGTTLSSNTKMREVAKQLGRYEHSINLEFDVPQ